MHPRRGNDHLICWITMETRRQARRFITAIQSITLICSQSEPEIIPGRTFPGLLPGNRPQGDGLLLKKGALFRLYVLGVVSSPEG
jgi:hypothetical protein